MKRYCFPLLLVSLVLVFNGERATAAPPPPSPLEPQVVLAVEQAIQREAAQALPLLIYETSVQNEKLSADAQWATAQLVPVDTESGETIPAEPGLAIAYQSGDSWTAVTQNDPEWVDLISRLPADLMPAEEKENWLAMYAQAASAVPDAPLGGYYLPWAKGTRLLLTRSIFHNYPPKVGASMHYAFDFATPWDSTGHSQLFPVHAAKAGRVKWVRWIQPTNSEDSPGNYIVLEDLTTTPPTYQLYLHLAYDSVPEKLRTIGTPVQQGQFLGLADDTGLSSGHHLHFQVHTNPNSYWGNAVDITFLDVPINGGRPRMPKEASEYPQYGSQGQTVYVSGNTMQGDYQPPVGEILAPAADGEILRSTELSLEAYAADAGSGIYVAQFLANWDGAWQEIGPSFNTNQLAYDWDLCRSEVPDGPVSLALKLEDLAGNTAPGLPGLRHFIKQASCEPPPPPTCNPTAGQVALYSGVGYTGDCQVYGVDNAILSSELGAIEAAQAVSIRVGASVQATVYAGGNLSGRGETFTADDPNLSDNRIGAKTLSSLKVGSRTANAFVPRAVYPPAGAVYSGSDIHNSWSLSWDDAGYGSEFQARIRRGGTVLSTSPWQADAFWHLGDLAPGVYEWQVRARNSLQAADSVEPTWPAIWNQFEIRDSYASSQVEPSRVEPVETQPVETQPVETQPLVSTSSTTGAPRVEPVETQPVETQPVETQLVVSTSSTTGAPRVEPVETQPVETQSTYFLTFDMEGDLSGWETSQNWDLTSVDHSSGSYSWAYDANVSKDLASYDTGRPNAGSLTTPAIDLAAGETYTLRFWYVVETESAGRHWDQRWVQLSVDGGPFTNLLQLGEDPVDYWLQSPPIDLSPYAGHAVRLRFYFATLDARDNAHKGWKIDDLTIETGSPSCSQPDTDQNTPASAAPLSVGSAVEAAICPAGDLDYFSFHAEAGEMVQVALEAQSLKSELDPQLELLAPDGTSVLAENDDLVPFNMPDSGLTFTAPQAGAYYLKVRAWDHPSGGGEAYFYRLRLVSDAVPPSAGIDLPVSSSTVSVTAQDEGSGVRQVEFYWHSGDWLSGEWLWLGYDTDGSDGWSFSLKPEQAAGMRGGALFIHARDWGGNLAYAGYWDPSLPFGLHLPLLAR